MNCTLHMRASVRTMPSSETCALIDAVACELWSRQLSLQFRLTSVIFKKIIAIVQAKPVFRSPQFLGRALRILVVSLKRVCIENRPNTFARNTIGWTRA
jgi:hypothetical protein